MLFVNANNVDSSADIYENIFRLQMIFQGINWNIGGGGASLENALSNEKSIHLKLFQYRIVSVLLFQKRSRYCQEW